VGGSNGNGAWRGLVPIVDLLDPRPYKISLPISKADLHSYTIISMSDRLLSQADPTPRLPPPPELRREDRPCDEAGEGTGGDGAAGRSADAGRSEVDDVLAVATGLRSDGLVVSVRCGAIRISVGTYTTPHEVRW